MIRGGDWYACGTRPAVVGRMSGVVGALLVCEVKTLMTPDHIAIEVRRYSKGRVGICRSSGEGLDMGRHVKAPDRCPCCWLVALNSAPLSQWLL